jgi:hypothetical protein
MMSDDRNYIEKTQNLWRLRTGEAASVEELMRMFSLHGPAKRISILDQMDAEPRGELELEDLRGEMERADIRHQLGERHEMLRRGGR